MTGTLNMRHFDFDDSEIQRKLAAAYPDLSHEERQVVLVELMLFVRVLGSMIEPCQHGRDQ